MAKDNQYNQYAFTLFLNLRIKICKNVVKIKFRNLQLLLIQKQNLANHTNEKTFVSILNENKIYNKPLYLLIHAESILPA